MIWIHALVVIGFIVLGARYGGIGLGLFGGMGLAILVFVFGLQPSTPPIDVMLIILAVISAAASLQASGGLDLLVRYAARLLRANPQRITILGPAACYALTFVAGTGHTVYSLLPVISEVALSTKVRPERPLSVAVIASQQAITASPISAATAGMLALLAPQGVSLGTILMICVPATLCGLIASALVMWKRGPELEQDPEYQRRLQDPSYGLHAAAATQEETAADPVKDRRARIAIITFVAAVLMIVVLGSVETLRPQFMINGVLERLPMTTVIEVLMLTAAAMILMLTRTGAAAASNTPVFRSGAEAVLAIFGVAWMGDTFIANNLPTLSAAVEDLLRVAPWTFALALFLMSILLFSQAATVRTVMPLGISLGLSAPLLVAMFPAVNGYFVIPNYPTVVAAIGIDRTGTTRIGKFLLDHSFMLPGLVATGVAIVVGMLIAKVIL
jgi:anaerobic C4-dicarboxylate transporter-like protein